MKVDQEVYKNETAFITKEIYGCHWHCGTYSDFGAGQEPHEAYKLHDHHDHGQAQLQEDSYDGIDAGVNVLGKPLVARATLPEEPVGG